MKTLNIVQMEQLYGGDTGPCSTVGSAVYGVVGAMATATIGFFTGGLGAVATAGFLSWAHHEVCSGK